MANEKPSSRFGRALYEALPEICRTRDKQEGDGALAAYLDACGQLLDTVYNTLDQRYKDCFPETCQEWLLPYFAQLVHVRPLSPSLAGRRAEIARAVFWRQGKGTVPTSEEIAREVGRLSAVCLREGWKKVARTIDLDEAGDPASSTVDLRDQRSFTGHRDVSRRFVDLRRPDWRNGHPHPRAVLLYTPPPAGFFTANPVLFLWKHKTVNGQDDPASWLVPADKTVAPAEVARYIGLRVSQDPDTSKNQYAFFRQAGVDAEIRILGDKQFGPAAQYSFSQLNLDGSLECVKGTRLILNKLAARAVHIKSAEKPAHGVYGLQATDCLLQGFRIPLGLARLEYCTLLEPAVAEALDASDCILSAPVYRDTPGQPPFSADKKFSAPGRIRYSRHHPGQTDDFVGNCADTPLFHTTIWGQPGCAVLHPEATENLRHGAEDGGEMGAFHHLAYALAWEAVVQKLQEYLPVGMRAAVIPDATVQEAAVDEREI